MATAYEHREAAEELLEGAADTELYDAEARDRMTARAHVHALIYLGMQFAAEFDPASTKDAVLGSFKAGAVERLLAPDNTRRKPRSVS